ncbi:AbrB/MazE/SpoVT family DNA-binding domain-containing protein [Sediminispirochaeta smaragdinae]|uniref:Transcriptional regulator/antitoxin, MazE n=1 Tax=Sediminispirochaeta smaragdinae (strain DSM 11293 / JCM 15392 / SEBR 4228) TaxID=573413 RepID=E1RBV8_SEDSS|nr:AbrB/MazE/SpoVT family DNA-binding domain-containing protein [Sediminispirochaeta smaragdinae]ADK79838.1 transcriptional regulator/antitoxin, MazE [Sediminispirochaeta smaragdinae DSM 11293]
MLVSVVPIGNSKGIRIPKSILQQLHIEEKVELEVHNKELLIRPIQRKPREGWSEKFMEMNNEGDDTLLIENVDEQDDFTWEW